VTAGYVRESPILRRANLSITGPGLIHLRGRNGSGKSTFGELVSGYLRPWAGQVLVNGFKAADRAARVSRRVCRAEPALFPAMTAHDHIALTASARGVSPEPGLQRARSLGLDPWLGENAGSLSTGTSKKLWYLMNTLGEFTVAVLDEPFNGVDAESTEVIAEEITSWSEEVLVVLIAPSRDHGLQRAGVIDIHEFSTAVPRTS
jgi:ABC-type multidrug transport system ATPase subunit